MRKKPKKKEGTIMKETRKTKRQSGADSQNSRHVGPTASV